MGRTRARLAPSSAELGWCPSKSPQSCLKSVQFWLSSAKSGPMSTDMKDFDRSRPNERPGIGQIWCAPRRVASTLVSAGLPRQARVAWGGTQATQPEVQDLCFSSSPVGHHRLEDTSAPIETQISIEFGPESPDVGPTSTSLSMTLAKCGPHR